MKKRLGLAGTVGLLIGALLLPAATQAAYAPYRSYVLKAACTNSGALYGFGKVVLKVEAASYADGGTNYFVFKVRRQEKIDGTWVTVDRSRITSEFFADGSEGIFTAAHKAKYVFPSPDHPKTRILMKVEFWDQRSGGDVLLARHGHRTEGC